MSTTSVHTVLDMEHALTELKESVPDVHEAVEKLEGSIAALESYLEPLLVTGLLNARASLCPVEKAKFEVTMAYILNSLYWVYLKSSGRFSPEHPINAELARVREYMNKIKNVTSSKTVNDDGKGRVDASAAGRFVRHALGDQSKKTDEIDVENNKKRTVQNIELCGEANKKKRISNIADEKASIRNNSA